MYPVEVAAQAGLLGRWHVDREELKVENLPAGVNPGGLDPWSVSTFNIFPNFVILLYERGWYLTYRYWPTSAGTHDWEMEYWFPESRSPRERIQHEVTAAMSKEAGLQDMATLDGTQQGLESRRRSTGFPLSDQEITVRHFHKVVADWVDDHHPRRRRGGADMTNDAPRRVRRARTVRRRRMVSRDRARALLQAARRQRMPELQELYDAAFPEVHRHGRAPRPVPARTTCPSSETNLLHLVYSLIQVSLAVDMWGQPCGDRLGQRRLLPVGRADTLGPLPCPDGTTTDAPGRPRHRRAGRGSARPRVTTWPSTATGWGWSTWTWARQQTGWRRTSVTADGGDRARGVSPTSPIATRWTRAFAATVERFGPVEILVTSAGLCPFRPFAADHDRGVAPGDRASISPVRSTAARPRCHAMVEARWGRLVLISSSSAQRGAVRAPHYAAAKGGVVALAKSLAMSIREPMASP